MRQSVDIFEGLTLATDGAQYFRGAANTLLPILDHLATTMTSARAGHRLHGPPLKDLTAHGSHLHAIAAQQIGDHANAVRAILFNKTEGVNWALGWHQDRTIAVKARHLIDDYGPWTIKSGINHVAPPSTLLAGMVTMRIHLDDTPHDNAPLLIAPGSHRLGTIREDDIGRTVERCGTLACLAERGDLWLYSTPILHASARAMAGGRQRRVLQLDFCAQPLPSPLEWYGV